MKKHLLIVLQCCLVISSVLQADKVKLNNGTQAEQDRVDEVWQVFDKIPPKQYHWLWRTCKACKERKIDPCNVKTLDYAKLWFSPEDITALEQAGITKDGVLDRETQNIVRASYAGTGDPKLVRRIYPVTWIEQIKQRLRRYFILF